MYFSEEKIKIQYYTVFVKSDKENSCHEYINGSKAVLLELEKDAPAWFCYYLKDDEITPWHRVVTSNVVSINQDHLVLTSNPPIYQDDIIFITENGTIYTFRKQIKNNDIAPATSVYNVYTDSISTADYNSNTQIYAINNL